MEEYFDGFPVAGGGADGSLLAHRGGSHARPVKVRRTGRHTRAARLAMFPVVMILTFALSAAIMIAKPGKAGASVRATRVTALKWAEGKAGCWYAYGGTSCAQGYDCSGLVMSAFSHAGYSLPRTTGEMLASGRIYRIAASQRRQGDLAFWGSCHVELVTLHGTFGAQQSGTRVGWHRLWGSPTFWRIR
jgi:hypothetical protein